MHRKLVINEALHETRVALLEDGNIVELFIERGDESDIAGNIYKGRVQRVLPGIQAAFIDIGLNQAAFIYVDDVLGERFEAFEQHLNNDEELSEGTPEATPDELPDTENRYTPHIEDLITKVRKSWCRWPNHLSVPRVRA